MLLDKYLQLILFYICVLTEGLDIKLPVQDSWSGSNILETAKVIKNITNDIFFAFQLEGIKSNVRLKQYGMTHNFFSSITLNDDNNLHEVAKASRVDILSNVTRNLVDAINDVLNDEPANNTEESNSDLQIHVDRFLSNLEYLKRSNGVNENKLDIDDRILQLLSTEDHDNVTHEKLGDNGYTSDIEYWKPEAKTRRIYKGTNTKVKYFPFMASVHIFQNFQCGGSIIKSDLVITAASCLQLAHNNRFFRENPAFLSVRIGSNYYIGGGESIAVLEVYFYPSYEPKTLKNNVALMRLVRRIKFREGKSRVKKIDFDRSPHNLPVNLDEGITIIGWGAKGVSNVVRDPWMNRLSFSVLDVYPLRECQEIYSKKYVNQKVFCAGFFSKGSGACSGDVGGPGIVGGVLAGIISFGSPRCGTPDTPTVFTKVGYYAEWIEDVMDQDVPNYEYKTTTPLSTFFTVPPDRRPTTFVLKPIFSKDFTPVAINADYPEHRPMELLRVKPAKHHQKIIKMKDPEEEDNLFKEFLAVMFGSNEVNDYKKLMAKKKKAPRTKTKGSNRKHVIKKQTTKADRTDIEASDDDGVENDNDDDQNGRYRTKLTNYDDETETTPSYKVETGDVVKPADVVKLDKLERKTVSDHNNVDNNQDDGDDLEENILKLIENLDLNSDKEIDSLVAEIAEEPHAQESFEDEDKSEDLKPVKTSRKDVNPPNTNLPKEIPENNDIVEINDHDNLDDGLSIPDDGFKDLTLREGKTVAERTKSAEGDSIFDFLPKEDMYELLAQAVNEITGSKL